MFSRDADVNMGLSASEIFTLGTKIGTRRGIAGLDLGRII